ncbi:uncharacterized protein A1O9_10258 [Exophiala aquamarina CBS 119918]|uniref:Thioesterase domain-containing protein n=1 Tax=Exophiala aquamarina CBS 119918 TaxID=1182545 RepID=A0A072P1Z8_9EURO|nr:uncharacterized protein A1O9_10258 [Exophiala aquamarina CBS 119918]KEF53856.1 hypothetical protein A1O9_10258 [Exophiala aquamarina CBS 119918]
MAPTFADVVPIKRISSHQYSISLEHEWCIGTVPNGGYVTSAFLVVARTHMSQTHSTRSEPDAVNLHLEFLRRTSVGNAIFTVQDVKLGSRISNLHITLSQPKHPGDQNLEDKAQGYITMSNIAAEEGLSVDTQYTLASPPALPVDLRALAAHSLDENYTIRAADPFPEFRRAAQNIQMFLVRPDRKDPSRPKSINDQWVRFSPNKVPNGRWTNDALGFLVDMFPQIVEHYINPESEEAAMSPQSQQRRNDFIKKSKADGHRPFWYPTLVLNLDVKKLLPNDGVEWLFVRVRAKRIKNGRFDLDIEVWDEADELVATSTHASLIVDASRNLAGRPRHKPTTNSEPKL